MLYIQQQKADVIFKYQAILMFYILMIYNVMNLEVFNPVFTFSEPLSR